MSESAQPEMDPTPRDEPTSPDADATSTDEAVEETTETPAETAEAIAETTPEATAGDPAPSDAEEAAPPARPVPRPGAPRRGPVPSPAALAGTRTTATLIPAAPPVASYDPERIAEAASFGSVAEDGTVSVLDGTQVRTLGTGDPADPAAALEPFARAYLDLSAFLDLTASRLAAPDPTHNDLNRLLENLRKNMKEPQVVGDVPALRARAHELRERAKALIADLESDRTARRDEAVARRTAFVESIEQVVATPPEQISWRTAGETMREMVPTWKRMQSEDVSIGRPTEDTLWKRLSAARSTFDRRRKQFFSQLDEKHDEAAQVKDRLIARAEEMQGSTDWGPTVRAYKDLMAEWREAPRGARKKDDAQWARFKAAQDTFFAARNEDLAASDAEQRENLATKEALLAELGDLDPAADLDAAKARLRSVQDRWEDAGKVPRADMRRVDDRLRSHERAVQQADEAEWRRTDPRTRERVEGASTQLHSAIQGYADALDKARASGDARRIAEAEAALEARKEWLAVIERSARDLG